MLRVVRWATRDTPWWVAALTVIGLPVLVSALAIPMRVTVDGILYISSARSIFTDNFAETYAWFREPGYPVFLAAVHLFGGAGFALVIVQALCLCTAAFIGVYCAVRALGRERASVGLVVLVTVLVLNPMYLIYSALVLQQALFALQLALFALALSWAIRPVRRLSPWVLLAGTAVNYVLCVWTSVGWIYLGLLPTAAVLVLVVGRAVGARVSRRGLLAAAAVLVSMVVAVGAVYALGLTVYGLWTSFRDAHAAAATDIPTSVISPQAIPGIPTVQVEILRMLALMHIGTVGDYVYENLLFLQDQLLRGYPHAEFDTAFVKAPYSEFALGYFQLTDPVQFLFRPYSIAARIASPLYALVWAGGILSIVVAVARSKWQLLVFMLLPFSYVAVYALSNSPIDRYGVPAYALVAVSVSVVVAAGANRVVRRIERRKPVPLEA